MAYVTNARSCGRLKNLSPREICGASPTAVRAAKRALVEGADLPLDAALAEEAAAWLENFASWNRTEGLTAFVERKAQFA